MNVVVDVITRWHFERYLGLRSFWSSIINEHYRKDPSFSCSRNPQFSKWNPSRFILTKKKQPSVFFFKVRWKEFEESNPKKNRMSPVLVSSLWASELEGSNPLSQGHTLSNWARGWKEPFFRLDSFHRTKLVRQTMNSDNNKTITSHRINSTLNNETFVSRMHILYALRHLLLS